MVPYIILESVVHPPLKTVVLLDGWKEGFNRAINTVRTSVGLLSAVTGGMQRQWSVPVKVRHTEDRVGWASLQDIRDLYSDGGYITFYDPEERIYDAVFLGPLIETNTGPQMIGANAWYVVNLNLLAWEC